MNKQEHVDYWIKSAEHDLETAKILFEQGKYSWCLFIGHLVLEKVLKAIYIYNSLEENINPPKIHNLLRLAEISNIDLSEDTKLNLLNFNDFNIEVRYPDYKFEFYNKCNKEFTQEHFIKIKEIYKCILGKMQ